MKKSLPIIARIPIGKVQPIKVNNSVTQLIVIFHFHVIDIVELAPSPPKFNYNFDRLFSLSLCRH